MINKEGTFPVEITRVICADPKFSQDQNAFDICIEVKTEDGQTDWWRGEMSNEYGKGNFADKKQSEITLDRLTKIGLPNGELTQMGSLVGMKTVVTVEATVKDNKTWYNVKYIGGGGNAPTAIEGNEAARRMSALNASPQQSAQPSFGNAGTQPLQGESTPTNENPFGKFGS